MHVIKTNQVPAHPAHSPFFTGSDVTWQVLLPESPEYKVKIVNFGKGG
ncbi:MAG: hypothetical protein GXO75_05580 [Calditrichaeota bacterium]|nr:hypothetical protein [Calditrichota bacterium]